MNKDDVQRQNRRARSLGKFLVASRLTGKHYPVEGKRNAQMWERIFAQKAREVGS